MHRVISQTPALFLSFAFAAGALAAGNLPPQTSSQSGVTVKVTPRSLAGAEWEFEVVFDTHSQELKDDLLKAAVLVADGSAPSSPIEWQGDAPGGHHRKGVLRFKSLLPQPREIGLQIARPGESAPRSFRWSLR